MLEKRGKRGNSPRRGRVRGTLSMLGQTRGQLSIFIIIAIVVVALIFGYFLLRGTISVRGIPGSIQPAYTGFLSCLEEDTNAGISVLESQGGYVELPEFEPGSEYMPFSSQLTFAGSPVPYWYYVSGNNIQKEQVPTKGEMEDQLEGFIEERLRDCNLRSYYDEGFVISMSDKPKADVNIKDGEVEVNLNLDLTIKKENDTALIRNHKISQPSKLGKLYDSAKTVYEEEQKNLFLERYAIDILRLYAPVDGVEITCAPLVWDAEEVFDGLQEAIEINTAALKNKGSKEDYFALNFPVDEDVRFLNSKDWPNGFEISPADDRILISSPVGNQPGIGALGFCYVPYHFVYNMRYPVMIQVYDGEEIFQFPVAVVIQGNNPREFLNATASEDIVPELCKYKNTEVQINTYDTSLRPVDAQISYECFGNKCDIGTTESGKMTENFPQCVNGFVSAKAPGFKDTRYLFSTVQPGSLDIILDRVYETDIELLLDGKPYTGEAVITFSSDYATETIIYPNQRMVELGEGQHEIQVQIFRNSSITIGATTKEQCIEVPRGILGVFGLTEERCFDIQVPGQVISNALAGGGKQTLYVLESELIKGNALEINARSLPIPKTIEQVQDNYQLFEQNPLEAEFK